MMHSISVLLINLARCLATRGRADWHKAMRAEFEYLDEGSPAQLSWALGCVVAASRTLLSESTLGYVTLAAGFAAGLIFMDWRTDNDVATVCVLVALAALLGSLRPRMILQTTIVTGWILLLAHAAANFSGAFWPFYQTQPLTTAEFGILAFLLLPAFAGARAGAALRMLLQSATH